MNRGRARHDARCHGRELRVGGLEIAERRETRELISGE